MDICLQLKTGLHVCSTLQGILTQPVQPVLSTTSVEEDEGSEEGKGKGESRLNQLLSRLSAAQWLCQVELEV